MLVPSTPLPGYQILNCGAWIYTPNNHWCSWTAGYAPASIFSSVFAPAFVLIQDLHSKEELKVTWHCAGAQATRTWDDQYWWFFQLTSTKYVSWTFMSSPVKMISLPAIPRAQVLHSFTEAHLLGKLILWSVMSHAKIATQLKSLNLLTQIDSFPFWANKLKRSSHCHTIPDKAQAKFSPFAFFLNSSDVKHKTERVQLIFWTLLTDAFIPPDWG